MAGSLFEVFGSLRFSAAESCPPELASKKVMLRGNDGFITQVSAEAACIASTLRALIIYGGTEEEIPVPLKQQTISKVLEYLNYHVSTPAGDIRTPLVSDRLEDSGASKWDSSFIAVDKEMIYELVLAGSLLGISSLFFLAGAKAALLTKGKGAAKLMKELGQADDLPMDEEEDVNTSFNSVRQPNGMWRQEGNTDLVGASAFMQGLLAAAKSNGALEEAEGQAGARKVNSKSWRHACWRTAALQDWQVLAKAPSAIQADRELIIACIMASSGDAIRYASRELREDRKLLLEAIKHRASALEYAPDHLREDQEFVLLALLANGSALEFASMALRQDRDLVLEAARLGCGKALAGAAEELRTDPEFVLEVVAVQHEAYLHAATRLQEERAFALRAAAANGLTLQHMTPNFRADRQIVAKAVRSNSDAVSYSHVASRVDLGIKLPWDAELSGGQGGEEIAVKEPLTSAPHMQLYLDDESIYYNFACMYWTYQIDKMIQFSASNTMAANMGQGNYIASNSILDKQPFYERPEKWSVTIMWGAVGHIGMRWKAFASADFMNSTPDMLTSLDEARKILVMTTTFFGVPEWYNTQMYDTTARQMFLSPTAGGGTGGGWMPSQTSPQLPSAPVTKDGTTPEQGQKETERGAGAREAPLEGWLTLGGGGQEAGLDGSVGAEALVEGAPVRTHGLASKNGMLGTLVRRCADGRWKVELDGSRGFATLRPCFLTLAQLADVSCEGEEEPSPAMKADGYYLLGTWDDWSEPQAMRWNSSSRCYTRTFRLTYCHESFVILPGSLDNCLHPAEPTSGCPSTEYSVIGPSPRRTCKGLHWTVGQNALDEGTRGAKYEVRLFKGRGAEKPDKLSWVRLGSRGG